MRYKTDRDGRVQELENQLQIALDDETYAERVYLIRSRTLVDATERVAMAKELYEAALVNRKDVEAELGRVISLGEEDV